jgi:uncharacterized protein YdaU (DUF1376 family)
VSKVRRVDFNPDEFLAGVFGKMTAAECGLYWVVCSYIYSDGEEIDEDHDLFARCLKMRRPAVKQAVDALVAAGKLQRIEREGVTKLTQKRVERELKAARKRMEGATDAAAARWHGDTEAAPAEPKGEEKQAPPHAPASQAAYAEGDAITNHHPPSTNHQPPLEGNSARACIEDFDRLRIETFGEAQARLHPNQLDLVIAQRWIAEGVTSDLWRSVFAARFAKQKADGRRPSDTLSHMQGAIADALAEAARPMPEGRAQQPRGSPAVVDLAAMEAARERTRKALQNG